MFYKHDDNLVLTIFWNSLYIAFLLLPLGINLPTPFLAISIILGLINILKSGKKFDLDNKIILLFPLYFIIMSFSLFYTDNISDGLNILQRSLSLFLFPLIFLFVKEDASTVRKLFDFLLLGLVISFFINFSISIYNSASIIKGGFSFEISMDDLTAFIDILTHGWNYFVGDEFSKLINPSYLSLYILLVLSYYLKNSLDTRLRTFIVVLLFLYLFLLASIAAYVILVIMSILLTFNIKDKSRKHTMFIMLLLGLIVFLNNPRVFDFYSKVKDFGNIIEYDNSTSEKARLLSWDASIKLIKEAPLLGYGIGDANDILIKKYKELRYTYNYENKYNAHNQFLQTFLQTGVIGFGVLVTIFILLAIHMKRSRNEFSVFLILFISLIFESMLVRFNGIVFFSIVIPLLLKKRSILSSRIIRNVSV
ncbi:O-antigen ligase family protein [Aquimarina sp. BL5]|uniref:O-antigen ligase family protein n=1 Tax=Aquimarina sp. BL5 TaxID=1714860 RepID=UPI000E537CFF|nr:O-antigen ligase family protein [Aquimarina sp. BL5]AXT51956.1 O-antigen ligase family protein [Aquimarina sp. BL5]RKN03960.1 O-antigen ligase family protein [Aquimarina sp. BL5]